MEGLMFDWVYADLMTLVKSKKLNTIPVSLPISGGPGLNLYALNLGEDNSTVLD